MRKQNTLISNAINRILKNIELERHTGKLVIISEPPDAFVILDNKEIGQNTKNIE